MNCYSCTSIVEIALSVCPKGIDSQSKTHLIASRSNSRCINDFFSKHPRRKQVWQRKSGSCKLYDPPVFILFQYSIVCVLNRLIGIINRRDHIPSVDNLDEVVFFLSFFLSFFLLLLEWIEMSVFFYFGGGGGGVIYTKNF